MKQIIFMPNEIFTDFLTIESTSTRSFAYTYYYYICYLYRYCLYTDDQNLKMTQAKIKQQLGYAPTNKKIDYIIKKNGLLDQMGYTSSTTDYPLIAIWDLDNRQLKEFYTIDRLKTAYSYQINQRNFRVKFPRKAIYRKSLSVEDGTFYYTYNTHGIPYEVFTTCMSNKQLGTTAFYILGFLKYKCNTHKGAYQTSLSRLAEDIHISINTIEAYLSLLKANGLIEIKHNGYLAPNTYRVSF